jgi:transposase
VTRRQLTDKQWKLVEPFLPIGEYGPYPERLREQFEGVIWRFRTSSQWREMPGEFGPWPTVYGRFRVWRDAGVFTALLEGLIAEAARHDQIPRPTAAPPPARDPRDTDPSRPTTSAEAPTRLITCL